MKQGKSLPEVLAELKRQNELKRDFIAPASAFRLEGESFILSRMDGTSESLTPTDLFHRQVGSTLDIPAKYYDRMRKLKPELLAQNVNTWFGEKDQSFMVRTLGSTARALLSARYRRIDNMEIASAVLPLFAGQEGMEVVSSAITEQRLYLKLVNHRLEQEVVPGDVVQSGVVISNSEVGLGAVTVQPLVFRLVCSNGMVVNDLRERKAHIGRAIKAVEESFELYSDETMEAEDKAFLLKLRDTARAALEEARFAQIVGRLRESAEMKLTGRVQDVVELTGKEFGLTEPEQENVLKFLIEGGDLSQYGLSNAVTRASQEVESYDRATALEGIGWDVATMPVRAWEEMNERSK